jgi:hypothetical protein
MGQQSLKNNNYSNCLMRHPDGTPMFRCGLKRLNWYLKKELAEVVCEDPLEGQFTFEPKGFGWAYDDYFLGHKHNICVICGTEDNLTRHHVIPYCYRRYFPEDVKTHNSYDVVLICIEHHDVYERKADELKKYLADKHEAPMNGVGGTYNTHLGKANGFRKTLLRDGSKIPHDRKQEMLSFIVDCLNEVYDKDHSGLAIADLDDIEDFDCSTRPHTLHGEIVAKCYDPDDFAIVWRKHFVEAMENIMGEKPQFLPSYWKLGRRVYQEARERDIATSPDWSHAKSDKGLPS